MEKDVNVLAIDNDFVADASGRFRQHFRTPRGRIQRHCRRQRVLDQRDSEESAQVPGYTMESGPTSVESLMEPTDAANSSAPSSSANSSVSNISMEPVTLVKSLNSAKTLFRKKSLVQLINSYIKAGIEEGAFSNGVPPRFCAQILQTTPFPDYVHPASRLLSSSDLHSRSFMESPRNRTTISSLRGRVRLAVALKSGADAPHEGESNEGAQSEVARSVHLHRGMPIITHDLYIRALFRAFEVEVLEWRRR